MPKGLICEKWELPMLDETSGFFAHTNRGELSRRALAFEWLVDGVPEDKVWMEPFAGIGLQSVIIKNVTNPKMQYLSDIDEACVRQLHLVLPEDDKIIINEGDAYHMLTHLDDNPVDVMVLDFPNFTPVKFEQWKPVLDEAFRKGPKLVEITDVSPRFLHLHKNLYSEILGAEINTKEDYIRAISKYIHDHYYYSVVKAGYKAGTAYMALGNVNIEDPEIKFFGPDMSGFRYLDDN